MAEITTFTPSPPGQNNPHAPSPPPHPISLADSSNHSQIPASALYDTYAEPDSPLIQTGEWAVPTDPPDGQRPLSAHIGTSMETTDKPSTAAPSPDTKYGDAMAAESAALLLSQESQGMAEGVSSGLLRPVGVQSNDGPEDQAVVLEKCQPSNINPRPDDGSATGEHWIPNHNIKPELPSGHLKCTGLPFVTQATSDGTRKRAASATNYRSTILSITITGSLSPTAESREQPSAEPRKQDPVPVTASPKNEGSSSSPRGVRHPIPIVQEPPPSLMLPSSQPEATSDTLSYLESASLMSGTLESLSGLGEDGSSVGSDSEVNGLVYRRADKYGFLGGTQYTESSGHEVRVDVARQREMKWLEMFSNWDKWVSQRFQKLKMRCRKGIPSSLRAKAWQLLSNSQELLNSNPGKFEALEREQGDPKWLDIIEKDLHRQFPFHEMFAARGGHGQLDLYRILKAYTVYRPEEGYCQAQAPVAAVLLMHMPAEQAFWCLVQICETYLPGYYSAGLEAIQLDGDIFFSLLRRVCPMAYRHLKKFKIDPILYITEWFMCIFSRSLPWACVLRVWDMFFCEGVKIMFRVGLVLLKQMLGSVDKLREVQGMYETMERLRNISPETIRDDLLVQEVISLPVTEALIEQECSIQVSNWRKSRGELSHNPSRRLHGARAIFEHKRRSTALHHRGSFSFLGGSAPSPGPLRASSSLLSLPSFRRSKASSKAQLLMGSVSVETASGPRLRFPGQNSPQVASLRPHSAENRLANSTEASTCGASLQSEACTSLPSHTLAPAPQSVQEPISPPGSSLTASSASPLFIVAGERDSAGEDDGGKKKKNKEEKKKDKEEEKQRSREQKEKEKKGKQKKEKEKAEKEKKKDKSGT
ncbi:uncharacterized protein [Paramormyrops kingsleyae]|uniref:TBC1 domain family, member 10b n=2 Tax=Paramormyrops kingsleyae TaxID=1676925 RepID=A0A3B3T0D1_9TELE|nr:TBC1 domain family member 10A-like isoform X1 [Paramormyrops kingsleyae]